MNPEIPFAKSMPDYIMRWLASRFLDTDIQEELGILTPEVRARKMAEDAMLAGRGDTAAPDGGTQSGTGNGGDDRRRSPRRPRSPTPRRCSRRSCRRARWSSGRRARSAAG